jgi:hypothetical protein
VVNQKLLDMLFRNEVIDLVKLAGKKTDFPQFCGSNQSERQSMKNTKEEKQVD